MPRCSTASRRAFTVRENSKSRAAELRLIVGPLPDAETASRLCAIVSRLRAAPASRHRSLASILH